MKPVYRWGNFRLNTATRTLYRGEVHLQITPKAVELLEALVQRRQQLVSKSELMAAVWPDRTVSEANIAQHISVLRRALGEEAERIRTFPGRGYLFDGEVEEEFPAESFAGNVQAAAVGADAGGSGTIEPHATVAIETPARFEPLPSPSRKREFWPHFALLLLAAGLGLLWWEFRKPSDLWPEKGVLPGLVKPPAEGPAADSARVTYLAGEEFQPACSPDGRQVAFTWAPITTQSLPGEGAFAVARATEVHLKDLVTGEVRRVDPGWGPASSPAWSPDGSQLALLAQKDGLYHFVVVVPLSGGSPNKLAEVFLDHVQIPYPQLDWSPDGALLAVTHWGESGKNTIWLLPSTGGELRPLTQNAPHQQGHFQPRFSPDGTQIAYIAYGPRGNRELEVVPVEGGRPNVLFQAAKIGGVVWRDNSTLLVTANHPAREPDSSYRAHRLWRVSTQGEMRPFPGGTLQSVYPVQIDYSRASGELIYGDFSARLQLWSFELAEKSGLPRWRPWISSSSSEMLPDWSPDGRWVSFGGDRQGVEQLWIVNAEGGEQRQRTQYPLFPSIGSWSPDSRFFAVADVQPGFRTGLVHRVDVLNGGLQVLNPLVQAFYVVYRPNGNLLALDGKSIIELHGDGTVCATLDIPALFLRASGNHIYLVKDRVKGEIWRYSPDQERKLELIVKDLSPPHHTFWTLGKRNLYYVAAPGGDRLMLRALDLASREVKDLGPVPGPPPAPFGAGLAVNPEETRLIVTLSAPGNGDLFRLALGKPE